MDIFYMEKAHKLAAQSHCIRRKVGAILVSADGKQSVSAVNNPFPHILECEENGCLREMKQIPSGTALDVCRCIHCETSLISQSAKVGMSTLGATVYTTLYPCIICARVLVAAGVRRIVYSSSYPDERAKELFLQSHIQVDQL